MRNYFFILLVSCVVLPAPAFAAVILSEIMYDVSGADTGKEWVEITNTDSSAVDATGYKFFEANTNHALVLISGAGVLQPGGSAVIADDAAKFRADWPGYSGALFDSSFSLSNTGESIALKDGALGLLDSVSYDPVLGAAGDGNSLQWNGSTFAAAVPTPGSASIGSTSGTTTSSAASAPEVFGSAPTYVPPPAALSVEVSGSRKALRDVPVRLLARATIKGGAVDPSARIVWSFGDGSSNEGSAVEKTYRYAGTYLVTATASDGSTSSRGELIVIVTAAKARVLPVSGDGITVANDSTERLDLSGWQLASDAGIFRIPTGTTLLPESSVLFPFAITNLPVSLDARLLYPNGIIAARSTPLPLVAETPVQPPPPPQSSNEVQAVESVSSTNISGTAHEYTAVRAPATAIELAPAGAALSPLEETASAEETSTTVRAQMSNLLRSPWTLGLIGVIALAGGAFILL